MSEVVLHTLAGTKKALDACRLVESLFLAGKRVVVVFTDAGRAAMFDSYLWTFAQQSFVPHALWSGEGDSDDPVVLVAGSPANPNGASVLVVADRLADPGSAREFTEVHDLVTQSADDAGKAEAWRAAGFEVREVRGVPAAKGS